MKINKNVIVKYTVLILVYFILLSKYTNYFAFDTDECDIFAGGEAIANGYYLYRDYMSQHMPFSYYISALFWIFGAKSIALQRIYFYLFFSIMWTIIVKRYQKIYFSFYTLAFFPIVFIWSISSYDLGYAILSEHLVGMGYIILLLEFLKFYYSKTIEIDNCVYISLAIVLSIGTAFISCFAIAVILLAVVFIECKIKVENKYSAKIFLKYLICKYRILVLICLTPWIILIAYYILTKNLSRAVYWSYTFNREVYSAWIGGYGDNILKALLGGVDIIFKFWQNAISLILGQEFDIRVISQLSIFLLAIIYIAKIFSRNEYLIGLVIVLFLIEASSRDIFTFHGTQSVEIMSLLATALVTEILFSEKSEVMKKISVYVLPCFLLIISGNYMCTFTDLVACKKIEEDNYIADVVEIITDKDEAIWNNALAYNTISIASKRPEIKQAAMVPWFWEVANDEILNGWNGKPPRVALFNMDQEVWGKSIKDYAPDLLQYIEDNYCQYQDVLYIRKDYYDSAVDKINAAQ